MRPRAPWSWVLGATALLTVAACAAMLAAPFEVVLREYSIDDSFYYSEVAKRFAHSGFSSFDGFEPTNGYHPLWMLLSSMLFVVGLDGEAAIYATRILEILLVALGVVSLQLGMRRAGLHPLAGALASVLAWRAHTLVEGLETALLFALLGLLAWSFIGLQGRRRWTWLGLLTLAAGLARLECFALVAIFAAVALWSSENGRADNSHARAPRRIAQISRVVVPSAIGLAAYMGINALTIGSALPVSGLVKQAWSQAARAASPDPSYLAHFLELWGKGSVRNGLLFAALACVAASIAARSAHASKRYWLVVACFGALHTIRVAYFTVTNWPPLSSFEHYYVTGQVVQFLVFAGALSWLIEATQSRRQLVRWTQGLCTLAIVAVLGRAMHKHYRRAQATTVDWEIASWRASQVLAREIPSTARIAAFDSGVLAFFSPQAVTNLDGLINSPDFHRAVQSGSGVEWLCSRPIEYYCNAGPTRDAHTAGGSDPLEEKLWRGLGLRGIAPRKLVQIYESPPEDAFEEAGRSFRVRLYRLDRRD